MKKEWIDYLQEIQFPERLFAIVESKIKDVQLIFGTEIINLFVSNRRTEKGIDYLSLWLFSDNQVFECKNFISTDDYDVVFVQKNILYVNVKKSNYENLQNPINESSIVCNTYLSNTGLSCSFNAIGSNCKHLMHIIQTKYIPNMVSSAIVSEL